MAMFGAKKMNYQLPQDVQNRARWNDIPVMANPQSNIVAGDMPMPEMTPTNLPRQRWLEGGKFTGKDAIGLALGAIGDAFTGRPMATQMVSGAFQQQRDMQQAELQRQQDWRDWVKKYNYEVANPKKTAQPHYWESNDGSLMQISPITGLPEKVYQDPDARMQFIPDGYGGGRWVAQPKMGMAPTSVPSAPVGRLTPIDGGPSQPATGGFR